MRGILAAEFLRGLSSSSILRNQIKLESHTISILKGILHEQHISKAVAIEHKISLLVYALN
jgi:hypothetical protein